MYLVVRDEEGVSDLQQIPYPLTVSKTHLAQGEGQDIGWSVQLLVRNGMPQIVIGVLDEVSGIESFVKQSVQVGTKRSSERGR